MLIWETVQHQIDRPVLLIIGLYLLVGRPALLFVDRLRGGSGGSGPDVPDGQRDGTR